MNLFFKNKTSQLAGFTLIEVIIALAIISIALTAIIKANTQTIENLAYLQNKSIAAWVGENAINEIQAGIIKLPLFPDDLSQHVFMLGQAWKWKGYLTTTPNPNIKKITIDIYSESQEKQLVTLEGFLYVAA